MRDERKQGGPASSQPYPGRNYGYAFDMIGNRLETTTNGRAEAYTPNILNQYEAREVARYIDISGSATAAASVSVNAAAATRLGEYFHHALDLSSEGNAARQESILITATLPDGGHNNAPRIAEAGKDAYLPPNPETYKAYAWEPCASSAQKQPQPSPRSALKSTPSSPNSSS